MLDAIKDDAATRMGKSIDSLRLEMAKIRTGRAHTSLLDHVQVEYYGSNVPINQVANVNVEDARTLTVTPWERDMVSKVEKAIMNSDLGLNPSSVGTVIRVPMPALTEERRKELVKVVRHEAENARVAIRNIRRDANSELKSLLKDKSITEDDDRQGQEIVQKLTDQYIAEVDKVLAQKEKELMAV
ncbi:MULTISPECIES: ribosome recycling factor [unclassified Ectothiorhodospira]|jgi:ribosome recycling factor|uniref:ribosome recycling factor n=1 Tax=unclassified Ectothiorhodospira TaxID=2684909 RepID=UPI001EE994F9|nr:MULTISPECIES: ribosome recycling factor [unclassified Ectothiorhodospira]MCG5515240.1 ribosome recycling factor [Ectothiorhodospira sp. 9100]MCG5517911.1 ribosome recycling factor [Ectothiorhodospira sp. 9905]